MSARLPIGTPELSAIIHCRMKSIAARWSRSGAVPLLAGSSPTRKL
jgi:hypothetical protein